MFFVEVILPLSLSKTFTYSISEAEFHFIKKGMRITVPFGKSKIYTALVIDIHQNAPTLYLAKEIHQILDETPIVNETQIAHWQWIASYYMCAIGDVYRGAMPSALLLESETIVSRKSESYIEESELSDDEYLVYQALLHQSSSKEKLIFSLMLYLMPTPRGIHKASVLYGFLPLYPITWPSVPRGRKNSFCPLVKA